MSRIIAVTGSASGIGRAVSDLARERGHSVVGIDLHDADVEVDLSTPAGRDALPDLVARSAPDGVDAVIAVAGVSAPSALTVRVNHFGAVATLEGLRPLLRGPAPRAVAVSSFATLFPVDDALMAALRRDDEPAAVERAGAILEEMSPEQATPLIYGSSKRALSDWIRRSAVEERWAGAGIPLNAVGPGVVVTPMVAEGMATAEGRAALMQSVPMPLAGPAEPIVIARLLLWLASEENTHVTGQVVFADGGADVSIRGPYIFD